MSEVTAIMSGLTVCPGHRGPMAPLWSVTPMLMKQLRQHFKGVLRADHLERGVTPVCTFLLSKRPLLSSGCREVSRLYLSTHSHATHSGFFFHNPGRKGSVGRVPSEVEALDLYALAGASNGSTTLWAMRQNWGFCFPKKCRAT